MAEKGPQRGARWHRVSRAPSGERRTVNRDMKGRAVGTGPTVTEAGPAHVDTAASWQRQAIGGRRMGRQGR